MSKILIALLLIFSFAFSCRAFELSCEEDVLVDAGETIDADFIAVAGTIEIKGKIDGDFIGIGRYIRCEGVIEDDVMAIAQDIDIKGDIGDSLRAAAETIKIDAHIKGDLIVVGKSVTLFENSIAEGDAVIAGKDVEINGKILQDLKVYGKTIKIKGEIAKNVKARGDRIILFPGARIGGDLTYTSANEIEIRGDAQIIGETVWKKPAIKPKRVIGGKTYVRRLITKSLLTLPLLLIGLILIGITPRQIRMTMEAMHKSPGKSLGFGFIFFACVPVATVILFATIIGIPLALITLLIYFGALYVSKLFAGMFIAMRVFRLQGKPGKGPLVVALIAGAVIVVILSTIPRVGGFIGLLLILFGLGGLVISRWKTFALAREKGLI